MSTLGMQPPGKAMRAGGGFTGQSLGSFADEHLEEAAFQRASQYHQQGQQQTSSAQKTPYTSSDALQKQSEAAGQKQSPPRKMGSMAEELISRPIKDVAKEITSIFSLKRILEINTDDTPEEQAKKKQMLSKWQQLDEEQKQVAQRWYEEKMKKKQQEEKEKEMKKQQEEEKKQAELPMPSSPKKGPIGPGGGKSQKDSTLEMLKQSRTTLSGPKGGH